MTEKPYLTVLRSEFAAAEESSFLIQLRCNLKWDKQAFLRLATAMEQCCTGMENAEHVDRWLADGFYFLSWFVQSWATHKNFPKEFPEDYYEEAFQLLSDLASYFFTGSHPYTGKRFRFLEQISCRT
jgi:hypothetical protein